MSRSVSALTPERAGLDAPPQVPAPSRFRVDVQGLRAVAVSSVVLYHLFPDLLPGGFVGVDVFFVISGFLITQHLYAETERTGRIRLTEFWARRIRRLLPASFTVLAASVVLVLTLMPRLTWQSNVQEISASAAYIQNWLLGIHAVDYLAATNSATVAQHYWSLSVEEQFYVGWPLLILGAVLLGRVRGLLSPRRAVLLALAVVAVGSFVVSIWFTETRPSMAFFATPTRGWEFAAGGLVGVLGSRWRSPRDAAWRAVVSWSGLVVILGSTLLITGAQPFPGWIALLPVGGAVLVLAGGDPSSRWSTARLAGLRPVQWLGAYSYTVYLWHWPLIIVAPWVLHHPAGWPAKLVIAGLSLVLAVATKRFVEDPVRTGRAWSTRRWPAYAFAAAGMAVLLASSGLVFQQVQRTNDVASATALAHVVDGTPCYGAAAILPENHCPAPFARPADLDLAFAGSDIYGPTRPCQQDDGVATLTLCTFGQTVNPSRTIVVVGNSHALRLIPALQLYGQDRGWKIILAAKTDCMGLITTPVGGYAPGSCLAWSKKLQDQLISMPQLDAVIFASHVSAQYTLAGPDAGPADVATASSDIVATWSSLRQRGVRVIVTEDVPGMRPSADPECIAASAAVYDPCALPRSVVVVPNLMTELAQRNPGLVSYVQLSRYFCDAELCHALIGGVVVYTDSHHLTTAMSRSLARYLGPDIEAAMTRTRG